MVRDREVALGPDFHSGTLMHCGGNGALPKLCCLGKGPQDFPTLKKLLTIKVLNVPVTKILRPVFLALGLSRLCLMLSSLMNAVIIN